MTENGGRNIKVVLLENDETSMNGTCKQRCLKEQGYITRMEVKKI